MNWSQRLGILPAEVRRLRRPIWIHAASVGEVLSAEPLVRLLRQHQVGSILVTTTSLTGRQAALDRVGADAVMLLPFDVPMIVASVLARLEPNALILVETELWPSLLRAAHRAGVPCALVSGRISPRSAERYGRFGWLFRPLLRRMSLLAMQSNEDAKRAVALGALGERVQVLGNLKFARAANASVAVDALGSQRHALFEAFAAERVVLVAASTHPGEEDLVLDACRSLLGRPDVLLVLAPRRPERFDAVEALVRARGWRVVRRSRIDGASKDAQIVLLDSVGELPDWLSLARGVYVGGTQGGVGGHNVLEPALFAKVAAFGADTWKVASQADALVAAGAAQRVLSALELERHWAALVDDATLAARMGERGRTVITAQASVAERTVAALLPLLS